MCLLNASDGYKFLFDPFISENPQTDADVSEFYDVDMIFVTHGANDHYGDVENIINNSKAKVYCGGDIFRRVSAACGIGRERVIATIFGDQRKLDEISTAHTVTAVHHSKSTTNGVTSSAPAFGFILEVEPGVTYYHAGDTSLFSDMKLYRELYKPNVMTVGISKFKEPNPPCEMPPREAAYAVSWIGPEVVIPTHYPTGSKAPDEFKQHLKTLAPHVKLMGKMNNTFIYTPYSVEWSESLAVVKDF